MSARRLRWTAGAACAGLAGLALAGCGGGAASNSPPSAKAATAPVPATNAANATNAASAAAAPSALDAASAQAFIAGLYANYNQPSNTTWEYAAPADTATFEPGLLQTMHDDETAHPPSESDNGTGWQNVDILCMCQEYDKVTETTAAPQIANGHAKAVTTVTITNGGSPVTVKMTFDLVAAGGQWRIYDITGDGGSFRQMVQSDLAHHH